MTNLRIRWAQGDATFAPGDVVRIGRDPVAEVRCENTNVSRQHAEMTHSGSVWTLSDVGSAQGTWRDGRRVDSVEVRGTVQVSLGKEGRGEVLTLEASVDGSAPDQPADLPAVAPIEATRVVNPDPAVGAGEGTVVVGAGAETHRPGGPLRADAVAGATVVTGDVLNLECAGRNYSFTPGREVCIGRGDECDVVSSNPTVSRVHARLTHDGTGWTLRDDGSRGGTYVDGRRITDQRLSGSVAAWLGDPATGERLVMVSSGASPAEERQRRPWWRSAPALAAAAVLAVVVIGGIVVAVSGGGGDGSASVDDLGRSTVRLIAGDSGGSGTIIDAEQGLILTNAHVVAPDAPGAAVRDVAFDFMLDPAPREVVVQVAPELGKAAEPRYLAEVEVVDGYVDLAVLRITKTIGGQLIEPDSGDLDGLVSVPLGDSSAVSVGDSIRVFGYPAAAQTSSVTLTDGTVSGLVQDERMGSNRAMLNITAPISSGNSGGLAVDSGGELIGVPSLIRDETVPSMRPSEFARPLIESARSGEPYVSPWYRVLTSEEISDIRITGPGRTDGIEFDCAGGQLESVDRGLIGLSFEFEGFTVGEHQDMLVTVRAGESLVGLWALDIEFPVEWPEEGCATVTIPMDSADSIDVETLSVVVGLGPGYDTTR